MFWSDLVEENVLPSLSTSTARWLSFLLPIQKLQKLYLSVLCHLMYQFKFHSSREQQKTITWLFQSFASWETRITLAGVQDILELCVEYKNLLENANSFTAVQEIAETLEAHLERFCRKNSALAAAMAGETDLPGGGSACERICDQYRREHGQKLHLLCTAGGRLIDERASVKGITGTATT